MVQQVTDNFWQTEARSEETKQFIELFNPPSLTRGQCAGLIYFPLTYII
jgi:hypothetical protein